MDGRIGHGDLRVHADAVHGQVVAEIGRGKAAGVIQGQHVPEIAAFPFRQAVGAGEAAPQQERILEGAPARDLLVHHPHPVGESPQDAAGDGFGFGFLDLDLRAVHLQAGGVPLPGIILRLLERGPVQVGQVVLEQGVVLVQRVQAGAVFQRQVGKLVQERTRKLVEQPGLRAVGHVLAGEKPRFLAVGGQVGAVQEVGHAAVHVFPVRQGLAPPGEHLGHHHLFRVDEFLHRHAELVHPRERPGDDFHRRLQVVAVRLDLHGVFLIAAGFGAVQVLEVQPAARDARIAQVPLDPSDGDGPELAAEDAHHQGLGRVHLLLRRARGGIGDPDDAPVPHRLVAEDDGRHHGRFPHVVGPVAVLHEVLRDHHREDVHLLLEFGRVDVAGHDHRLRGGRGRHLGEGHEQGGVQRVGVIHRHPVQVQDRGTVEIPEIAARAGADSVAGQIGRLQRFLGGRGGRLAAADHGEIGIALALVILDHIVGHTAAQGPFLDLGVHRQGGQRLRWHSS